MNTDEQNAFSKITINNYKSHLQFLADDLLEGRGPATRGDALTQKYITTQFQQIGLEPGGENGIYLQQVPIVGIRADHSMILNAALENKKEQFKFSDEFIGFSGLEQETVTINDAELVFVGYGIDAPEQQWNDYKDVDVKGKILLMMNNDPKGDDKKFFGGNARTYYGRWTYKYEIAAKKGAIGAIIIHTTESAGYPFKVVQTSWSGEEFSLAGNTQEQVKLKGWLTEDASKRLVQMAGKNLSTMMNDAQSKKFTPVPLGIKLSVEIKNTIRRINTANIGGLLRGSDAQLSKEVVVITAHHDHLGIGSPVNGDSINNGAIDNASGISMILSLAKGFTELSQKPKRSILFLAVAAEESGLLGSRYYCSHPTFAPQNIAAAINIDGVNMFGETKDISMVGKGKSTIDNVAEEAAKVAGYVLNPDQFPEQGFFYRSDQFNFAKIGIPCGYFSRGIEYVGKPDGWGKKISEEYTAKDYHQPSDEIRNDWTYEGTLQQAKFYFHLIYKLAQQQEMPTWNKGDEFELIRLKSLGK